MTVDLKDSTVVSLTQLIHTSVHTGGFKYCALQQGASSFGQTPQIKITERGTVNTSRTDRLTDRNVKRIVRERRLINIVEDSGVSEVWKETLDSFFKTRETRKKNTVIGLKS